MKRDFSLTGFMVFFYIIASFIMEFAFSRILTVILIAPTYIRVALGGEPPSDLSFLQAIVDAVTIGPAAGYFARIPSYFIAMPLVLKLFNGKVLNADEGAAVRGFSFKNMAASFICLFSLGVVGNLLGKLVVLIYNEFSGRNIEDLLSQSLAEKTLPLIFIFMVILTPIFEEFMYRYGVISRIRKYGEVNAIFVSAVIFALMHRNIFQLFYTFFAGLVFGYIYIYTGRLRYSIMLHMLFNFFGAFLPIVISPDGSIETFIAKAYVIAEYLVAVSGLILLFYLFKKRKLFFSNNEGQQNRIYFFNSFINPGMILFTLLCVVYALLLVASM